MNPLDALELAIKCVVSIGLVFCLPWGPLVRRLLRPYPPQPEPFEPFAWNGPEPDRWLIAEYFAQTTRPGYPLAGHHLHYSDDMYEFISTPRIIAIPEGTIGLSDGYGNLTGYLERNFRDFL